MNITAVIPVRAGSTRVKNKNIREFAGSSLLEIKINQLLKIEEIDQIIVSSDSDEMLDIAKRMGVTAKKRPYEYCDEKSRSFREVVKYIAQKEVETDTMMWVPCVCPLVLEDKIREGIQMYKDQVIGLRPGKGVCTATVLKEYLYGQDGPINFTIESHVKSQDLPDIYSVKNGFFIATRMDMYNWQFVYGNNPLFCKLSKIESIDIDDEYDFELAEMLYKKYVL